MASGSGIDLSQIPLSPPPPGEVTDFVDAESISWAGRLAIYLTLPIMAVAYVLRSYVRIRNWNNGIDDLLLFFGVASAASFCGVLLPVFNDDVVGRHAWNIPVTAILPWFFEYSVTAGCVYNVSAMFTKTSILALYFRVFRPSHMARVSIWIGIIVISVSYTTLTATMIYYMVPHKGDGGWGSDANRHRMGDSSRIIDFTQGVFSAVSDLYVLIIPTFVISSLHLPLKRKIGIVCIFLAGLLSCGCSIAGTVYRYHALVFTVEDNRWNSVKFEALCVAELNVGIACACVPVIFTIFKSFMQHTESGLLYLKRRLSPRATKETEQSDATGEHYPQVSPQIPKGTLTGLGTFFRGAGRTKKEDMETTVTAVPTSQYLELRSIDMDYHAQMRQDSRLASKRSLVADRSRV